MNKRMDLREFWADGYLQEANRQFFHPLGLALAVRESTAHNPWLLECIWDARDDPEGFTFDRFTSGEISRGLRIVNEQYHRAITRSHELGYVIQPLIQEPQS